MNAEPTYRVRWKGQVSGPYNRQIITQKLQQRELSLAHEVELDGAWRPLRFLLDLQAQTQEKEKEKEKQRFQLQRLQDQLDDKEVALREREAELQEARDQLVSVRNQPPSRPFHEPIQTPPHAPAPSATTSHFGCPQCGSPFPPQIVKRLSGFGWLVFVVGLLFCLVGCLAALLFIEEKKVCPSCGGRR